MPHNQQFALFIQKETGPLWRRFFDDADKARKVGQALANKEGFEFFLFDFKDFTEIARFFPYRPKRVEPPA